MTRERLALPAAGVDGNAVLAVDEAATRLVAGSCGGGVCQEWSGTHGEGNWAALERAAGGKLS